MFTVNLYNEDSLAQKSDNLVEVIRSNRVDYDSLGDDFGWCNVIGTLSAGIPYDYPGDEPSEVIPISKKLLSNPDDCYCFKIAGNSMMPKILDGDYVILNKVFSFENLSGKIIAVNTGEGITLKRFIEDYQAKKAYLQPVNEAYNQIIMNEKHRVFGSLRLIIRHIFPD
jgi:SOS-response transcriptional repressor LexA